MKTIRRGPGILWMVRLLGALGFVMVAVIIGQSGLQLQSIRNSRMRLQEQQEHLNQPTREILKLAGEARTEIQAALDEDTPFTEKSGAVTSLAEAARQLSRSTDDPSAFLALNRLAEMANKMSGVEKQALAWRANTMLTSRICCSSEPRCAPTLLRCATKPNCRMADDDCKRRFNSETGGRHKVKRQRAWR